MNQDILNYNVALSVEDQLICKLISTEISENLTNAESKIWHAHPVWFLNGNPIVGYSKQKTGIRLDVLILRPVKVKHKTLFLTYETRAKNL